MSDKAVYFAMYPTDFLADIGHLGNTELGIYWRLLLVYYRDRRPLPMDADKLRRLAMTFSPEECKALDSVMAEFFRLATEPDGTRVWRHKRADQEIARAANASARKSDAAKATNAKRWGRGSLSESLSDTHSESPSDHEATENQNQITTTANAVVGAAVADASDTRKQVFDAGVALLAAQHGEKEARSLVGRMRKALGDSEVLDLIRKAGDATEPVEWLMKAASRATISKRISDRNGGAKVVALPDGRYRCGEYFYSRKGEKEVAI